MKTVGNILKEARTQKKITLEQAEKATKIRVKFLEGLEEDEYGSLPSVAYAKGFVKNYSEYLGLDSSMVIAFFRRQNADIPKSSLLPAKSQTYSQTILQLTPGRFLALVLGVLVIIFLGYLGVQYRNIQRPAPLTIESPVDQLVTGEKRIDILGSTNPDATVTVNGISILVRSDGKFFDQVTLVPGVNKITIVASSRFGKTTTIVREVGLQNNE